jgi:hypothetical protein
MNRYSQSQLENSDKEMVLNSKQLQHPSTTPHAHTHLQPHTQTTTAQKWWKLWWEGARKRWTDEACRAAAKGNLAGLRELVNNSHFLTTDLLVNRRQVGSFHSTVLIQACVFDQRHVVTYMLDVTNLDASISGTASGLFFHTHGPLGQLTAPALSWAARSNRITIMKMLLVRKRGEWQWGVDPNAKSNRNSTALEIAAQSHSFEAVEALLRIGVYCRGEQRPNPAHETCVNCQFSRKGGVYLGYSLELAVHENGEYNTAKLRIVDLLVICGAQTNLARHYTSTDPPMNAWIKRAQLNRDLMRQSAAIQTEAIVQDLIEACGMPPEVCNIITAYAAPTQMQMVDALELASETWRLRNNNPNWVVDHWDVGNAGVGAEMGRRTGSTRPAQTNNS